jgi:predicted flap endonuclease-1-like 5' DNA nuclease
VPAEPAPIGDVVVGDAPATDMPLDVTAAEDAARGVDSGRPAAQVASEASEQPPDDAEIGTPLVLETDAPQQQREIDDLQRISGVGPALERQLHAEGITTYRQLAVLDETAIGALESRRPRLVTRMRRGGWVAQARRLHVETHGTQP